MSAGWRRSPRILCLEYIWRKIHFHVAPCFYCVIMHSSSTTAAMSRSIARALCLPGVELFSISFLQLFPRGNVAASSSFLFSILWSSFLCYSRELIICTELFNYSCSFSSPENSDYIMVPVPRHMRPKNAVHHSSRLQALREKVARANQKFIRRQHYQQSLMYDESGVKTRN